MPTIHDIDGSDSLRRGLQNLRKRKRFCDLVVECDDEHFDVHRCVLCAQSSFFDRVCGSKFEEAGNNRVRLEDDEPGCGQRMLEYFYQKEYTVPLQNDSARDDTDIGISSNIMKPALIHVQMYALGEKYIALGLKTYAQSQFAEKVQHLSNADLASVTKYVYESTHDQDRGLRDIILRVVITKVTSLMQDEDFCRAVIDIPRFGFEFLAWTVKKVQLKNLCVYKIRDCSHCPAADINPVLYCRHNRAAEQIRGF